MRISYWSSDVCSSDLDIVRKRLQKAVDAPDDLYPLRCEDTPGCIPIDLFGPAGSITQAQLDSVSADHYRDIKADLRAFVLNLSGPLIELPYGTVNIAAGAEYRAESYSQIQETAADYETQTPTCLRPEERRGGNGCVGTGGTGWWTEPQKKKK